MRKISLLLTVFMLLFLVIPAMAATSVNGNQVTFTFKAPDANMVYLSGNFNGWSPSGDKMTKGADGVWSVTIKLKPGTYQYKFVVDGKWITDEDAASFADDGFGGKNSVLIVRAENSGADNKRLDALEAKVAAIDTSFQFHGYARSGILMNDKGGSNPFDNFHTNVKGWGPAAFRLGNESDTYYELDFAKKFTLDNGSWATAHFMVGHKDGSDSDSEENGSVGYNSVRQTFVEMGGLEFAPNLTFWAGRRYYDREDIHLMDFYWKDMSGIGAGVQGINLGNSKLAIAFLTKSKPNGDTIPNLGQFVVKCWDFKVTELAAGPGNLDFDFAYYTAETGDALTKDVNGYHVDVAYGLGNFFGFAEGSSKVALQYGVGAGQDFNIQPWGDYSTDSNIDSYNKRTKTRLLGFGVWQISQQFEIQPALVYQFTGNDGPSGSQSENWYAFGFRPVYHFNKNFALQFEAGRESLKRDWEDVTRTVTKFTIAPTLTLDFGYYTRPQLRAFATYATWDNYTGDQAGYNQNKASDSSGMFYGVQMEVWW
ncbi:MAG: carbohydrate porin [Bacillota bacterium]